jgi:hypothetical protein
MNTQQVIDVVQSAIGFAVEDAIETAAGELVVIDVVCNRQYENTAATSPTAID